MVGSHFLYSARVCGYNVGMQAVWGAGAHAVRAARWGAFGAVELWDVDGRVCDAVEYAHDGEGCVRMGLGLEVWCALTPGQCGRR